MLTLQVNGLRQPSWRLHLEGVNKVSDLRQTVFELSDVEFDATNRPNLRGLQFVELNCALGVNVFMFASHSDLFEPV